MCQTQSHVMSSVQPKRITSYHNCRLEACCMTEKDRSNALSTLQHVSHERCAVTSQVEL